jgi:nicotinamide-nucleotide amidase
MKKRFAAHGFELTPNNLRQVRVPHGAEALPNEAGIAPGFCVRMAGHAVYFLPGIPREMERIYLDHVAPGCGPTWPRKGYQPRRYAPGTSTAWANRTSTTAWPSCLTASLTRPCTFAPTRPRTTSRWSFAGPTPAKNQELLEQVDHDLRKRIGPGIYGIDGETFALVVGKACARPA